MLEWNLRELDDDDEGRLTEVGTHDSIVGETEDACLIEMDGEEVWFPRSVLREDLLSRVWASNWYLKKEGLT